MVLSYLYHYYNDLNTAKTDINYHWDQIQNRLEIKKSINNYDVYPFRKERWYATSSYTINAGSTAFISLSTCKTSGANQDREDDREATIDNYFVIGVIGAGNGDVNKASTGLAVVSFGHTGFRLYNYTSSKVTTSAKLELDSNGAVINRPPYIDILYIRKDAILWY